jgi:hypothetical protein
MEVWREGTFIGKSEEKIFGKYRLREDRII